MLAGHFFAGIIAKIRRCASKDASRSGQKRSRTAYIASVPHNPPCRAKPLAGDATVHAPHKHAISWHVGRCRGHEREDGTSPALLHTPQKAKGATESAAVGLRAAAARVDHAAGAVRWL